MTQPPPQQPPASPIRPPAAALYTITQCLRCDYPLAGLNTTGACPECNTSVADSLRGWELPFASRRYLSRLHRGLTVAIPATFLLSAVWTVQNLYFLTRVDGPSRAVLALSLSALSTFSLGIGFWLFTTPEPAAPRHCPQRTASRSVRSQLVAVTIATLLMLGTFASQFLSFLPLFMLDWLYGNWTLLMLAFPIIIYCSLAATMFALARYTRILAFRLNDNRMARVSTVLQWLLPSLVLSGLLGWLITRDSSGFAGLYFDFFAISALAIAALSLRRLHKQLRAILATIAGPSQSQR